MNQDNSQSHGTRSNSLHDVIQKKKAKFAHPDKNVSQSFQIVGYEMAQKLGDLKHKSLYIKLAKEEPRSRLEQAFRFAIDYPKAQNRGKLFMYKLKELKKQ